LPKFNNLNIFFLK